MHFNVFMIVRFNWPVVKNILRVSNLIAPLLISNKKEFF